MLRVVQRALIVAIAVATFLAGWVAHDVFGSTECVTSPARGIYSDGSTVTTCD